MIHRIIYYSCWGCHHVVPFTAVCTFLVLGLFLVGIILAGIWFWVTLLNWCYCGARCAFNNYTAMCYFISDLSWGIIMIIFLHMITFPTWKWGILVARRSPVCPSVCPSVCGQNRVRSVTAKIHNGMRSGRFVRDFSMQYHFTLNVSEYLHIQEPWWMLPGHRHQPCWQMPSCKWLIVVIIICRIYCFRNTQKPPFAKYFIIASEVVAI